LEAAANPENPRSYFLSQVYLYVPSSLQFQQRIYKEIGKYKLAVGTKEFTEIGRYKLAVGPKEFTEIGRYKLSVGSK
jgi:hypothetical protein